MFGAPLSAHTPNIEGVPSHHLNFGGGVSEAPCFTVFSGGRPLNLGGEIASRTKDPNQELSGTPNHWYFLKSIAGTNGRRIAVQKGGVLQHN